MQTTKGLHSLLSSPIIYDFVQDLAWGTKGQKRYISEHLRPTENDSILDVGCGSGRLLKYLPACNYVGIDLSDRYIDHAKRRAFDGQASFVQANAIEAEALELGQFTVINAIGLLHHLDDHQVVSFLSAAQKLLVKGGRIVTVDPGIYEGQGIIGQLIVKNDRGKNVRTLNAYTSIIHSVFPTATIKMTSRLTRLPVDAFVATCQKQ